MSLWSPRLSHSNPCTIRGSYACFCLSPTTSLHASPCVYIETRCPLGHMSSPSEGCSRTVTSFSAIPVQAAWPSPRFRHVHLPSQGCPHLLCPPGAWNNSSMPPGVWCTYPATALCCAHTQPSPCGPGKACTLSFIVPMMWHQSCPL